MSKESQSTEWDEEWKKFQNHISINPLGEKRDSSPPDSLDINWKDKHGKTILHYAATYQNKIIFEKLYEECKRQNNYAPLGSKNDNYNVLHYASWCNNGVFEYLHQQEPERFFEWLGDGQGILGSLMRSRRDDPSINRIIDDIFATGREGLTKKYQSHSLESNLDNTYNTEKYYTSDSMKHVLHIAISLGNAALVKKLIGVLDKNINDIVLVPRSKSEWSFQPEGPAICLLRIAVELTQSNLEVIKAFCQNGAYDNVPSKISGKSYVQHPNLSALSWAIKKQNIDAITAVIQSKADRCYIDKSTRSRIFYQNLHAATQNPNNISAVVNAVVNRGDVEVIGEDNKTYTIPRTQDLASIIVGVAKKSKGWLKDNENDWKLISGILTNQSLRNEHKKEIVELALQEIRSNKLRIKLIASLGDEDLIKSLSIPSRPSLYQAAKEWFGFYNEPKITTEANIAQAPNHSSNLPKQDKALDPIQQTPPSKSKVPLWAERVGSPERKAALEILTKSTPLKEVELMNWIKKAEKTQDNHGDAKDGRS